MPEGYLINNEVEFWPERRLLISRALEGKSVTINLPVCRCLLLLIEKRYSLVTQNELFDYVWEGNGVRVSPNTLYQNISLLRKGINAVSSTPHNVVITIPKKGFKFNDEILVVELRAESAQQEKLSAEPIKDEKPEKKIRYRWGRYSIITMLLFLFTVAAYYTIMLTTYSKPFFENYLLIKVEGECHFFGNIDAENFSVHEKAISMVDINCHIYPYVYITAYTISPSVSLVACNKPIAGFLNDARCSSYTLRGVKLS